MNANTNKEQKLDSDQLFSTQEVGAMIGISERTLISWRNQGSGPRWYRLGARRIRYPLDELRAWIRSKDAGTPA